MLLSALRFLYFAQMSAVTKPEYIEHLDNLEKYIILYDTIPLTFRKFFDSYPKDFWYYKMVEKLDEKTKAFAISQSTKNDFLKYCPKMKSENITVIPLATNDNFYKCNDKAKIIATKKKYNIPLDKKYIFSVGDDAYEMYEKAPGNIQIIFPMKNGVIARFDDMQYLLGDLLKEERSFIRGAEYVIAVPTDVTEVEKKAFYDLVLHSEAKAKSVRIVERGLADGLGLGLDVLEEPGAFIANLGGGTTELSVLSYGGIVMNRLLKIGGEQLDSAIANLVRHSKDFMIGRPTAERLRKEFGVFDQSTGSYLTVYGRDLMRGGPSHIDVPISLVRAAIKEPLRECVQAIHSMLDRTPPDVRRNINKNGIYITGGLANLRGISTYLEESIGLPVHMKTDPELCAVKGLQRIILNKTLYRKLSYSMLDEDYRWLR